MTAPGGHPGWCQMDRDFAAHIGAHTATVGHDVELGSGLSLYVELLQVDGRPAEILLGEHTAEETGNVSLTVDEALQLRDLLNTATALVLREGALGG